MQLIHLFSLIASAFAGASMGSFLLLTLINKPVLEKQLAARQLTSIYARFYRLNSALCLIGGLLAALIKNQQAALVLAIIAVSYVFSNMHLLKGIISHLSGPMDSQQQRALNSLYLLQNMLHFLQFMAAAYAIYLLN